MNLANGDSFSDKSPICWTLVSGSFILFEASGALAPKSPNILISRTEHVLADIGFLKDFGCRGAALTSLWPLGEGVVCVVLSDERLEVL